MASRVLILSVGTVAAAAAAVYPKTILSSGQVEARRVKPSGCHGRDRKGSGMGISIQSIENNYNEYVIYPTCLDLFGSCENEADLMIV